MRALRWGERQPTDWGATYVEAKDSDGNAYGMATWGDTWARWLVFGLRRIEGNDDAPPAARCRLDGGTHEGDHFHALCTIAEGEAISEAHAMAIVNAIVTLWGHTVEDT